MTTTATLRQAQGKLFRDGEKTYTYDQANRLIRVTTPDMTWSATQAREELPDLSHRFPWWPSQAAELASIVMLSAEGAKHPALRDRDSSPLRGSRPAEGLQAAGARQAE